MGVEAGKCGGRQSRRNRAHDADAVAAETEHRHGGGGEHDGQQRPRTMGPPAADEDEEDQDRRRDDDGRQLDPAYAVAEGDDLGEEAFPVTGTAVTLPSWPAIMMSPTPAI